MTENTEKKPLNFIEQIVEEDLKNAVNGGKVMSDWPGLASKDLYEGRDLYPTMDLRSLFKGILQEHFLLPDNFVERVVFPDSIGARPIRDIVRG